MARAHNVYLVQIHDEKPLAAFTVKKECRVWLNRHFENCPPWLKVWRLPDGRSAAPINVTGEMYQFPKLRKVT